MGKAKAPKIRPLEEGRYTDFFPVGRGGMGIVYWALDTDLGRQIAFKILAAPPEPADGITPAAPLEKGVDADLSTTADPLPSSGAVLRFLQEARITAGLDHPGIVPVYEMGETPAGVPYYTMRFVRGDRTLETAFEELADAEVGPRLEALLEPFLKVCDTLRYAHRRGVVHRDLKPSNIALGEYGEVVVLDWGLARLRGALDEHEDPWAGQVEALRRTFDLRTVAGAVGTPGYLSPEAARGETDDLDERADIYALGVILFRILTGRLPFPARTVGDYLAAVLSRPAPDAADVAKGVPPALAALCRRALDPDPDRRPQDADAFANALRVWRADAAREREIDVELAKAETALSGAERHPFEASLPGLDTVGAACRRILDLRPDHPEATLLLARARALREQATRERERQARRRLRRRFGLAVLAGGLAVAVVITALLETRRQEAQEARVRADAARARADRSRRRAEDVMRLVVFDLQDDLEGLGRLDVLARVGATAKAYYADLEPEGLSTEDLAGHSLTLRRLGEIAEARGDLPTAIGTYRLAARVAKSLLDRAPGSAIGRYHRSLAEAHIAMALFRQGYASDARRRLLAHREDVLRLLETDPTNVEVRTALAQAHAALGRVYRMERAYEDAGVALDAALGIVRDLENERPGEEAWPRRRLALEGEHATLDLAAGRVPAAFARAGATLGACLEERAARGLETDARWLDLEADSRLTLARMAEASGQGDDGLWRTAQAVAESLCALDPEHAARRARVVRILVMRSSASQARGAFEIGLRHAERALELGEGLLDQDPTNATWLNLVISICDRVATLDPMLDPGGAREPAMREEALRWAKQLVALDPENPKWRHLEAYTLAQLGRVRARQDPPGGQRLLDASLRVASPLLDREPDSYELVVLVAFIHEERASLHVRAGQAGRAEGEWRAALDVLAPFGKRFPDQPQVQDHLHVVRRALAQRADEEGDGAGGSTK